jgi:hypothetical protein
MDGFRKHWPSPGFGVRGNGVGIAFKEACKYSAATAFAFDDVQAIAVPTTPPSCDDAHMGMTISVVNTIHATRFGVAPNSEVYVQNDRGYSSTTYPTTDEWVHFTHGINGPRIKNFSVCFDDGDGPPNAASSWHDYISYYFHNTITESSGNAHNARSCNASYNPIKVGKTADCGTADRTDDQIMNYSWANPNHGLVGDRELPEIVAPGEAVNTAHFGAWSGTSVSAPITAGSVALMQQTNWRYKYYPEAAKASLMAGAACNLEGLYNPLHEVDARDGAGLLDATNALWTSWFKVDGSDPPEDAAHDYGYMWFDWPTHFDEFGYYREIYNIRTGIANPRVRVVLTWSARPNCDLDSPEEIGFRDCWDDQPDVDLDMFLYRSDWVFIAQSTTWDSNFEMITADIDPNQNYFILIHRDLMGLVRSHTRFAIAWMAFERDRCL